jgi:hypothetical protein
MRIGNSVRNQLLTLLIITALFTSCDIINPEEEIPAYISIDTFILNTVLSTQGPANHNITDAFIQVNGDFVGLYELPCEIPVLDKGEVDLFIKPVIKNNGIASSRIAYPFYENYTATVELNPLEVTKIEPHVKYWNEVIFDWFENFSEQGNSLDTISGSTVGLEYTNYNGSKAGLIRLPETDDIFRAESIESFEFPSLSYHFLYMEMDYIANQSFTMGMIIVTSGNVVVQPIIHINPSDHWNKIYIDLSYYSQTSNNGQYWVYLEAIKSDDVEEGEIIFDNLKILRF